MFYYLGYILRGIVKMFGSNDKEFSAEFGRQSDISSPFNKGVKIFKHGRLSVRDSMENVLVSGASGSGKTTKILVPAILELRACSMLITDFSHEIYELVSGTLSKHFRLFVLNPSNSDVSVGWNPLNWIKKPNDINKIAKALIAPIDKGTGDPYWAISAQNTIAIFIRITLHQDPAFQNLANVLFLLKVFSSDPKRIDVLVAKTKDKILIEDYKSLVATSDKTLSSIISSTKVCLSIFEDEEVAKTTSHDTIDLDSFRERPTIIFIHSSIAEQNYIAPLLGLFAQQFIGHFLEKLPEKKALPVFQFYEELSSFKIDGLQVYLSNLRKYRVASILCLQEGATQLKVQYGEDTANAILANCKTKLFLPGISSLNTLKMIESLAGKKKFKHKDGRETTGNLINAEEVRMLKDSEVLVLHGNKPVIKGKVQPFYKNYGYRKLTSVPPVPFEVNEVPPIEYVV